MLVSFTDQIPPDIWFMDFGYLVGSFLLMHNNYSSILFCDGKFLNAAFSSVFSGTHSFDYLVRNVYLSPFGPVRSGITSGLGLCTVKTRI